eukprot:sb/3471251/
MPGGKMKSFRGGAQDGVPLSDGSARWKRKGCSPNTISNYMAKCTGWMISTQYQCFKYPPPTDQLFMYDQYMTQRVNATAYYHGPLFAHPKDPDHEHHQQHHDSGPGHGQLGLLSSSPPMFIRSVKRLRRDAYFIPSLEQQQHPGVSPPPSLPQPPPQQQPTPRAPAKSRKKRLVPGGWVIGEYGGDS